MPAMSSRRAWSPVFLAILSLPVLGVGCAVAVEDGFTLTNHDGGGDGSVSDSAIAHDGDVPKDSGAPGDDTATGGDSAKADGGTDSGGVDGTSGDSSGVDTSITDSGV